MSGRRIVVTGMGAVSPLGIGADTLFDRWSKGESGISDGLGRASDFDPAEFLKKKEIKRYDRFSQMGLVAADEAVKQAGWDEALPCDAEMIGSIMATGSGGIETMQDEWEKLAENPNSVSGLTIPKTMCNAAAGVLAMRYGLEGPAFAVVSACSSAGDAIATGMRIIRLGEADAMLVGGAEAQIAPLPITAFSVMEALSPTGMSRPFDKRRDGFVMGEGAGVLLIEALDVAEARGATILAELLGQGTTNDAYHLVAPRPDGRGAISAMRKALADGGIEPEEVDYINAHGTGTPANDKAETAAIKEVFGAHSEHLPVSSLKSAIGHLIGAAGAVEAIGTIQALRHRVAPPTLNYEVPDEGLDLDYVPKVGRPLFENGNGHSKADGERVIGLSNVFGFGGHNSVLAFAAE
jgi:3-oxoacyl-[acyl-carrier-protein] synthase II